MSLIHEMMKYGKFVGGGNTGGEHTGDSASIDVTAAVGQTIVVEEVDANGKPTKWKAADYQPRTHWTEETVLLPETTVEVDPEAGFGVIPVEFMLEGGKAYTVKYNGVDYANCECLDLGEGAFALGNLGAIQEGLPVTAQPFALVRGPIGEDDSGNEILGWICVPLDGSASATLSIAEVKHTLISVEYVNNALPYYIEVTGSGTDDDPYVCNDTVANVEAIYKSGRQIAVRHIENVVSYTVCELHGVNEYHLLVGSLTGRLFYFRKWGRRGGVDVNAILTLMCLTPKQDGTYSVTENYPDIE